MDNLSAIGITTLMLVVLISEYGAIGPDVVVFIPSRRLQTQFNG
jgi:hypothetical protein